MQLFVIPLQGNCQVNKKEFEVRFGYFEKRKLHDNMKPLRRRNIHAQLRRNSENEFNIDE